MSHSVGYLSAELEIALVGVFVALIFADYFLILFRHDFTSSIKKNLLARSGLYSTVSSMSLECHDLARIVGVVLTLHSFDLLIPAVGVILAADMREIIPVVDTPDLRPSPHFWPCLQG